MRIGHWSWLAGLVQACLLSLLVSCGGGGGGSGGAVDSETWYGNSVVTGDWRLDGGTLMHSSPTPIERLNAISPVHNVDRARNGMQLHELLLGLPVAMDGPSGPPVQSLSEQLSVDPSAAVVLALGEVEALFTEESLYDDRANVLEFVRQAQAAGKVVRIAGLIRFAPSGVITPQRLARRDQYDQQRRQIALERGLAFYDRGAAQFNGASDERPDNLHPGPEYQQRLAEQVAADQGATRR